MNILRQSLFWIFTSWWIILFACGKTTTTAEQVIASPDTGNDTIIEQVEVQSLTPRSASKTLSLDSVRVKGLLWMEGDQFFLMPTTGAKTPMELTASLVEDERLSLNKLYKKTCPKLSYPQEPVFVDMILQVASANGENETAYVVSAIQDIRQHNYHNTEFPYEFWAMGNEPFWSVEVSPQRNVIALKSLADYSAHAYPYKMPVIEDGTFVYTLQSEGFPPATLRITRAACQDDMSGKSFTHQASLETVQYKGQGCATTFIKAHPE